MILSGHKKPKFAINSNDGFDDDHGFIERVNPAVAPFP